MKNFRFKLLILLFLLLKQPSAYAVQQGLILDGNLDFTTNQECWAIFFDVSRFRGQRFSVVGGMLLEDLHLEGKNWRDRVDSVLVGPKAKVIYYKSEKFQGPSETLLPGSQVSHLDTAQEGAQMRSLKVQCNKK